jgi:hypothetical protein
MFKAIARDPLMADACLLDERNASLFVMVASLAHIPADKGLLQSPRQRYAARVAPISISIDEPHRQLPASGTTLFEVVSAY